MSNTLWIQVVAGGPLILGAAIAFAMMTGRRLSRREEAQREAATREMYDKAG